MLVGLLSINISLPYQIQHLVYNSIVRFRALFNFAFLHLFYAKKQNLNHHVKLK